MHRMTCGSSAVKHGDSVHRHDDNVIQSSSSPSAAGAIIKRTSVRTTSRFAAVAGQDIQAGARSLDITTSSPLDVSTVFWEESKCHPVQSLEITLENGHMTSVARRNSWMKHVQLSSNCHTQNIQIAIGQNGNLFLEATRHIQPEEPLYAWFSMETTKMFNIPFLALQNILGDRHYRCHQCNVHYQNPNPLKIHLAFFCHEPLRRSAEHPVSYPIFPVPRLANSSSSAFTAVGLRPTSVPLTNSSSVVTEAIMTPSFTQTCQPVFDYRELPFCRHSTFAPTIPLGMMDLFHHSMPYAYEPQISIVESDSSVNTTMMSGSTSRLTFTSTSRSHSNPNAQQTSNGADVNTHNVSVTSTSNGRQKRRHKCPYCGKLYSRKYGLKIHVRTHTGYKPLKCKVCFRPFGDPSNLNKHVRLHAEGLTPYRCDHCGKVLVRRRDLDRHLRSRHPNHDPTIDAALDESNQHLGCNYSARNLAENLDIGGLGHQI